MAEKVVTIAEFADSMQADLARQLLGDFGIRAMVMKQNATDIWLPTNLPMTAKLQVLESDVVKAQEILKEQESSAQPDKQKDMERQ
ncbi:MAG: DUF2007 domain-containing protein [Sedimentisphaerales bacterium]|nr:DUF2007 domain-containing protein [Sedimentisphaerales bacterium]